MYNNNRSYVYNKAFAEWFKTPELWSEDQVDQKPSITNSDRFELIRDWARSRGLYDKGNSHTQYVKLQEEAGELAKALLKDDKPEVIDAIGDMVVVLTNLAHLQGVTIEDCVDSAYKVISTRTGKMINGTFVKDE
jgi:NTP pyrophosphatase (non-canonical NTP hydrolase)